MSLLKKLIAGLLFIVSLIIAFTTGILWNDLPGIKFVPEIKPYEILNLLITLSIGISIPLIVKKWIDDNRPIKTSLVDEIKRLLTTLEMINSLINNAYTSGSIKKEEKDKINYLFHQSELELSAFEQLLVISFKSESKSIIDGIKNKHHSYKNYLTGGELMISTFNKIDDRFFREHNTEHSKIETHLKTAIHLIHRL